MGADVSFDPLQTPDVGDQIIDFTKGAGVGVAVEATGVGFATMPQIEIALGLGGKVILIGLDMRPVPVSTVALQMKAAEIYSSLGHLGGGFEAVIGLHSAGRLDMTQMVSSRYSLDDGLKAIGKSVEGSGTKVLIYANGES
jgi:scyllo-inosose 3-dehydrogenase